MTKQGLKPCPFCGYDVDDNEFSVQGAWGSLSYVICPRCLARGPADIGADKAILLWNRRL